MAGGASSSIIGSAAVQNPAPGLACDVQRLEIDWWVAAE